jgi:hypothetical protein
MPKIYRSFIAPDRTNLTWKETWENEDKGLIKNYEVGRTLAKKNPELAEKAQNGELPQLGYKGGIKDDIKSKEKIGTLNYLAQWQALRGEDLNLDTDKEIAITCTRTNVKVTFTNDLKKIINSKL